MIKVPKIQYITRDDKQYSHAEQARLMFSNNISWVQVRMKDATDEEIVEEAREALQYAKEFNGTLIINDSIEICKAVGAHGVHLGLKDISIDEARQLLGSEAIIGGTANTLSDVLSQYRKGADYIGLGPFTFTETKKNLSPILGLEGYRNLTVKLNEIGLQIPIVAVGGITYNDIEEILNTGINGVAMSGTLFNEITEKKINLQ